MSRFVFCVATVCGAASESEPIQMMQSTMSVDATGGIDHISMEDGSLKLAQLKQEIKAEIKAELAEQVGAGGRRRRKKRKSSKKSEPAPAPSGPTCEEQCNSQGFTCKACTNTACSSTWAYPSCAMGCHIGSLSTSVADCEAQCDSNNGGCNWNFRGTMMNNCGPASDCEGADRGKSSVAECKVGCKQSTLAGPLMDAQDALDAVNKIRATYGIGPMTYKQDGEASANQAAAYNAVHGPHKCGIDGVCNADFRAAGDCYANDKADAIIRMYETRFHEGPADGTCDEQSHCGALLIYNQIAIGYDEAGAYAVLYYWD